MEVLSNREIKVLERAIRADKRWAYMRWVDLTLGVGILIFAFWLTSNRDVLSSLVDGAGIFGALGALGAITVKNALIDWNHNANKLLIKLTKDSDVSVT